MITIIECTNLFIKKFPYKEIIKPKTKTFVGITYTDLIKAILSTSNLTEAASLLGCSMRTVQRSIKEILGHSTSNGGGKVGHYILASINLQICHTCGEIKYFTDFHEDLSRRFKISSTCKSCKAVKFKDYYKEHKSDIVARVSLRRANLLKATPKWADNYAIQEIYDSCPPNCHVDHIIPLKNDLVCGLHVENNLQIISAEDNLKKSNKFSV